MQHKVEGKEREKEGAQDRKNQKAVRPPPGKPRFKVLLRFSIMFRPTSADKKSSMPGECIQGSRIAGFETRWGLLPVAAIFIWPSALP